MIGGAGTAGRVFSMDVAKILAELKAERAQIEEAILSLERLALGRKRGPGRPRGTVSIGSFESSDEATLTSDGGVRKRRGRPPGSKNKPRTSSPIAAAATN